MVVLHVERGKNIRRETNIDNSILYRIDLTNSSGVGSPVGNADILSLSLIHI